MVDKICVSGKVKFTPNPESIQKFVGAKVTYDIGLSQMIDEEEKEHRIHLAKKFSRSKDGA